MFDIDRLVASRLIFRCHDQSHDQTVETQDLSEDQNQNHSDVQSEGEKDDVFQRQG